MKNLRISKWCDEGKIKEALVGDGPFFVPDHTYREQHDRLLVLSEVADWASTHVRQENAECSFFVALDELFNTSRVYEGLKLVHSYFIQRMYGSVFPLDEELLAQKVRLAVRSNAETICSDDRLKRLATEIDRYVP